MISALVSKTVWQRSLLFILAAVMTVGLSVGLSSCSEAQLRTEAAQVPRLVVSSLSDPKTFNAIMSEEQNDVLGYIYDSLLSQNGLTGELEPGLAESWEISDDQLSIVFTLREDLKWSDGEPFTVDDILFTYNQIIFNEQIATSDQDIFRIGEAGAFPQVTRVDDRRVQFRSPEAFAPLLRFAGGGYILPKHILETSISTTNSQGQPLFISTWGTDTPPNQIIGTGPYRLVGYEPSQRIMLERNPYYWRKDAEGNQQPYIEQVVIQIVESTDNSLVQFRSGSLDVEGVSPDYFSLLKREEERGNFTIYSGGPALTTSFLTFNLNTGSRNGRPLIDPIKSRWFNSLEFRKAVAHAIDRQTMINNIYQGLGVPQISPMYIQSPYYASPEEAGIPIYDYDPEQSKQLLQSAGFQYNAAGQLTDSDGNRVRFTLITNAGNKIREALGAQIKQDLSKIGIQVDFQPIAFNTIISKMDNTIDWEALILGIGGAGVEPDGGRNTWSVDGRLHVFNQAPGAGQPPLEGREIADWEEEISRLYVQGSQELDEERRKAIYAQTQRLAQENLPFIYLVNPLALTALRNRVEGVKYSALGGTLWNIYELRITEQ
ncbi:ABC transporter substrate-binding protein [Oculatella sp. LEGE 06141]|uniref:ABC transporter substrate-binding protein n=1 Tax=Oculatella sp. LEGE 06141 TaxID=1828648 RepID=UPI001D157E21|nr:ABC transporter substrate-binding protein [Oculatella sp. LEGE 06141]